MRQRSTLRSVKIYYEWAWSGTYFRFVSRENLFQRCALETSWRSPRLQCGWREKRVIQPKLAAHFLYTRGCSHLVHSTNPQAPHLPSKLGLRSTTRREPRNGANRTLAFDTMSEEQSGHGTKAYEKASGIEVLSQIPIDLDEKISALDLG